VTAVTEAASTAAVAAPAPVGFILARPDGEAWCADWDGEVHEARAAADAELSNANVGGWQYRVLSLVHLAQDGAAPDGAVGYLLVRRGDAGGLEADWDGAVHPSLDVASAELAHANEGTDEGDGGDYRVVALVDAQQTPIGYTRVVLDSDGRLVDWAGEMYLTADEARADIRPYRGDERVAALLLVPGPVGEQLTDASVPA